jgi:hypothetical protein
MAITQLIYSSRYRKAAESQAHLETLRSILATSQANNTRDGLTGFLLFDQKWFFQILEGEHDSVITTYNRIQKDARHDTIELMALRQVGRRSFPEWSMGGAMRSLDQQEIFLRHGVTDGLDPKKMVAPTVVALAMDLQEYAVNRREALKAAS